MADGRGGVHKHTHTHTQIHTYIHAHTHKCTNIYTDTRECESPTTLQRTSPDREGMMGERRGGGKVSCRQGEIEGR